jgi:hypothetical protein
MEISSESGFHHILHCLFIGTELFYEVRIPLPENYDTSLFESLSVCLFVCSACTKNSFLPVQIATGFWSFPAFTASGLHRNRFRIIMRNHNRPCEADDFRIFAPFCRCLVRRRSARVRMRDSGFVSLWKC